MKNLNPDLQDNNPVENEKKQVNENISTGKNNTSGEPDLHQSEEDITQEEEETTVNDSDLTSEDLQALGESGLSMDLGDDEQLKLRSHRVDFSGDELDIPGSELDDDMEEIGSEDEENNYYSMGQDMDEDQVDED